jgi:hypothetical protein
MSESEGGSVALKLIDGLAVAFMGVAVDLQLENASAPALFNGSSDVPVADVGSLHSLE